MTKRSLVVVIVLLLLTGAGAYFAMRGEDTVIPGNDNGNGNNNGTSTTTEPFTSENVRISSPLPNAVIASPVTVRGEARGNWFFEANIGVSVEDANGKMLGQVGGQAQGEWMTTNFVPFTGTVTFSTPTTPTGFVVISKDNPSGLPQHDASVRMPIRFATTVASKTPIQDAIRALLAEWNLPGVTLEAASLNNGVLTLTFSDPQFQTSGGSARVIQMRNQIEATAKQFAGVNSVRLMPNSVFQP